MCFPFLPSISSMFLTSCLTCCQEEENVAMEEILKARVTPRPFRPQQRFKVATSSCTDSQDESAKAKPGAKNFNHGIQLLRSEQSEPQLHIDSQTIQKLLVLLETLTSTSCPPFLSNCLKFGTVSIFPRSPCKYCR